MPLNPSILILPAFNEANHLDAVLRAVAEARLDMEVVVIDDGSQDQTSEIAACWGAMVLRHPFNLGYGAALQTGYKYALERGASLLVQMDADGQHDPREIPKLTGPIVSGEHDLIVGSRFLVSTGYQMGFLKTLGRRLFSALAHVGGLQLSDPTSGFQAMNRAVLEVYARDFFPTDYPDVDVLLAAHRHGLRVGERLVHMTKARRKSTLHGGLRDIYYVYKMLLSTWSTSASMSQLRDPSQSRKP